MAVYDYVIVGGGTAGLVMANRLTEDPKVTVAVLEAGQHRPDDPKINIPALMNQLYGDPAYDWNFKTIPQSHLDNRTIAWPRGKVLGGSSAINFLMQSHASKLDIDNWEKLGNPGWNFESLAPYYRKSETLSPPDEETVKALNINYLEVDLHGSQGPVQTGFPRGTGPADGVWGPTFDALGLGVRRDPRHGATLGGYPILKYMDQKGKRSTTASTYYATVANRQNLTLIQDALVKRIIFDDLDGEPTASGVEYDLEGQEFVVHAAREVILSAGTVMSPKILELSGIGSKATLDKFGIKTVVENDGVGENLQDHLLSGIGFEAKEGVPTAEMLSQPGVLDWAMKLYSEQGAGPLASGVTGTGFLSHTSILPHLPSADSSSFSSEIDTKTASLSTGTTTRGLGKQRALQIAQLLDPTEADLQFNYGPTGVNPQAYDDISQLFTHSDPGAYVGIVPCQTHSFSRGNIHVQSSDPTIPPLIDPKYFSHPLDQELMALALMFTHTLASTSPLADLLKDDPDSPEKGVKKIQPSFHLPPGRLTRDLALIVAEKGTMTSFHPVGTCSMLPREDGGVVDPQLRVYGTKNLRVVDASVIPLNVRGNIVSSVYAVAERAADIVKEGWERG